MSDDATYQACTRAITVSVEPVYLESESSPEDHHFVWAYHVRIENQGMDTVQLRNRYWRITDSLGRVHEVRGAGVVGEQPILQPGEAYEYSSGTPLDTPSGFMVGTYEMQSTSGELFDVAVPAFSLDLPDARAQLH
jgi:ApaG protein